jgi:Zn-dependent M28 family amino/carboxypeptidase
MLNTCALGGSISTDGPLQGPVVEVSSIQELDSFSIGDLNGKIVFLNGPMDKTQISTFDAYGACVSQRYAGASEAAKYGAIAVVVRSMTTLTDVKAHTGSMAYTPGVPQIPAAAISTQDADILHNYILELGSAKVTMNLNCYTAKDKVYTHNLVAEIKGSEHPEQVIAFGAHIDSWDIGEGAHDDGAGVVQCMEVLRIFKAQGIKPKNTIRMVLYMNEENGNMGGKTYAAKAKASGENHLCAIESDRGGFSPRGFSIDGSDTQVALVSEWQTLLEPYGLHYFEKGYGGVDIGPLKSSENIVNPHLFLMGLYPDSQRYFDYHHSSDDVFENVNKRELQLGALNMAALIWLVSEYGF